jgi:mono/diheme cytochrome c family protein
MSRVIFKINMNARAARRLLGALALTATLAGCAARLPEPGTADAARAERLWPGTTVSDLDRGKQQYVQSCASCHVLYDPREFPQHRWPEFVKEMADRSRLSRRALDDLTRYLVVAAEAPRAH